MVVADAESPGPSRKRPRLSLKHHKAGADGKEGKQEQENGVETSADQERYSMYGKSCSYIVHK